MRRTSKSTKKHKPGLIGFALLLTCLAVILSGCQGLRPFPVKEIIEYDTKNKVCGLYQIVDFEKRKIEFVRDIACPDVFGFRAKDIPKVLDWAEDAQKYAKEKCN